MKTTISNALIWWANLASSELENIMKSNFLPHVLPHKLTNQQIKILQSKEL